MLRRRELFKTGVVAAGALAFGPRFFADALASPAEAGPSPYGPLGPPDENGILLPEGFSSRVVARGTEPVAGTAYPWHIFSDGAATFATPDGGWILVSNSEVPTATDLVREVPVVGSPGQGGASAIRFDSAGDIVDAYRILTGTSTNCGGGPTPWGTWLSCEEFERGQVWECDPEGNHEAQAHPALGVFQHEAACVDPKRGHVYLTEDLSDGGFYRFTPQRKGDLGEGSLEIARVNPGGAVEWKPVPDPLAETTPTREQVPDATRFRRGEGIWYSDGSVYVATTADSKIHRYDTRSARIEVIYDPELLDDPPLTEVDNITVSDAGELFACEDTGGEDPFDIAIITPPPKRVVDRFLKLTGPQHGRGDTEVSSEVAGVCFNPPGDRMYFASQRAYFVGVVYEVSGPFRGGRPQRP